MKLEDKLNIFQKGKLYPILDFDFCKSQNIQMLNLIELWEKYSDCISFFQLRAKSLSAQEYEKLYSQILREFPNSKIVINDFWKFGLELNAFGIHIGKEDYSELSVREKEEIRMDKNVLKGTSSHSIDDLKNLEEGLWNYTGLGPIFETTSKKTNNPVLGTEIIKDAISISKIQIVPIGGINLENFISLFGYGKILPASISMMTYEKSLVKIVDFIRNYLKSVRESQSV